MPHIAGEPVASEQARPPAESEEHQQVKEGRCEVVLGLCSLGEGRDSGLGHRSAPAQRGSEVRGDLSKRSVSTAVCTVQDADSEWTALSTSVTWPRRCGR